MDVRNLTLIEIADLLDEAWLADLGTGKDGLDEATRAALADRPGCDEDLRAEVWAAWRIARCTPRIRTSASTMPSITCLLTRM